jgi:hypothetical protein
LRACSFSGGELENFRGAVSGNGNSKQYLRIPGTAQESDEGCILGGFLENDDFSPSGKPNIRFRRKWAEFAALLWKWRAAGGREE